MSHRQPSSVQPIASTRSTLLPTAAKAGPIGYLWLLLVTISMVCVVAAAFAQGRLETTPGTAEAIIGADRDRPTSAPNSTAQLPHDDLPALPWPPPTWTEMTTIRWDAAFPQTARTLDQGFHRIAASLRDAGIAYSVFSVGDDGFAVVTRRQLVRGADEVMYGRSLIIAATNRAAEQPPSNISSTRWPDVQRPISEPIAQLRTQVSTPIHIFVYDHRYERSDDGNAWMLLKAPRTALRRYLTDVNLLYLATPAS